MSEKTSTLLRKYQRKTGRDIKQLKNMYKLFNWKECVKNMLNIC